MAAMNLARVLVALVVFFSGACLAQEQAFTNRATELKERGASDARALATLPEGTPVKVLQRAGGWTQVSANNQQGWVRVFHLRFPTVAQTSNSSGNAFTSIGSALGLGGGTRTASTATIGIRGLSPEDLKNASPDDAAVQKMQSYRADAPAAERFARDGKLSAQHIDYDAGRR
jgi:hypothetical protein